jgi:hypothetical protein
MRTLLRLVLVVVVLIAAGAFFFGYDWGASIARPAIEVNDSHPVGTSGQVDSSRDRARETGAKIGEAVGDTADRARDALQEGAITAKVKSKIGLDDTLKGTDISVSTDNGVVTLKGSVLNSAQRQRAAQLARETAGVTRVVDELSVKTR